MSYKKAILRSLSPIMGKVIAIPAISEIIAASASHLFETIWYNSSG
jgi:hypothetical protein